MNSGGANLENTRASSTQTNLENLDNERRSSSQTIRGNSEGWWIVEDRGVESGSSQKSSSNNAIFRSSRTFQKHNQASSGIQEINVRRNGVVLSVVK